MADKKAAREAFMRENQCSGTAKTGARCKNIKLEGSDICRQCQQKAAKEAEAAAKAAPKAVPRCPVAPTPAAKPAASAGGTGVNASASTQLAEAGMKASGKSASESKSKEVQDWLCGGAEQLRPWPREPYPNCGPPEAPLFKPLVAMSDEEYEALPFPTGEQAGITKKQMKEVWNTCEPGSHYGMTFPHSIELLEQMGAEWLTKAFHTAGTLPSDNRVTALKKVIGLSLDPAKGEALGGAGIKVLLVVEYAKPHRDLHEELFVKIPNVYVAMDAERYKIRVNGQDELEILFSRLVAPALPLATPKLYFGDFCRKNGNVIMIFEKLNFAKEWKPFAEYRPFEIHPMLDKNKDWQVSEHGRRNYPALGRAMAKLHAAYYTDRLGPKERLARIFPGLDGNTWSQLNKGWPPPELKDGNPEFLQWLGGMSAQTANQVQSMVIMGCDFALNVCPQLFPPELRDRDFLRRFVREATHVGQYETEINMFMQSDPDLWCIAHGNIQIDNAFYYNNERGEVEAGLLDFGGISHSNPVNALVRNWIAAEPEVMDEIDELILDSYLDELRKQGGPEVARSRVLSIARLTQADFAFSMAANLVMLYGTHPKRDPIWKDFKDRWDPRVENVFLTRIFTANFRNMMLLWRSEKRAPYQAFLKWIDENPWLPKKPPVPEIPPNSI